MTPDLTRHILRGGQIPGVPKQMLDTLVANYLHQMARAAQMAQQGVRNDFVTKTLPPLSDLPVEFLQQVATGRNLPGCSSSSLLIHFCLGLNASETAIIKDYYLQPAAGSVEVATAASPAAGGAPGVITGLSTDQIISRLPKNFDMSRLPSSILRQISSGQPLDISQLPDDMLRAFRDANPDLATRIDEAVARAKDAVDATTAAVAVTRRPYQPGDVIIPYDIHDVDKQGDVAVNADGTANKSGQNALMLWTGVGLAAVFTISVLTIGYMIYRRRRNAANVSYRPAFH